MLHNVPAVAVTAGGRFVIEPGLGGEILGLVLTGRATAGDPGG